MDYLNHSLDLRTAVMQRTLRHFFSATLASVFFSALLVSSVQAAKPVWTYAPQTLTDVSVPKTGTAQVIYTIENQSSKKSNLVMKPIPGVTQSAPCVLPSKGTCTLTLDINGSLLQGDVLGGPVLCLQANPLQCYQPSPKNALRIHLLPPAVVQYTVTPSAGPNGSISPNTPQIINAGSSLAFTATPDSGFGVTQWLLDGTLVQNGGTTYLLNNIQSDHQLEVNFGQSTLTPLTQSLALSIISPGNPPLLGNPRTVRIQNTGSQPANNLQVTPFGLPTGTSISSNTCTGTLSAGAHCDITITPGNTASPNSSNTPCTTAPGTEPVPATLTVSAINALPVSVDVLFLGYGCIYQGGFLFSVDDSTPATGSIGGKVAALSDQEESPSDFTFLWATLAVNTAADSITNGLANTNSLTSPAGQYPAAQACLNKTDDGFSDWYMPAICELGRFVGSGGNPNCPTANPNLYTVLRTNNLGAFANGSYWSSTEFVGSPAGFAWGQDFQTGGLGSFNKTVLSLRVRCVRAFTP
jgi:hypothetical protein